MFVYCGWADCGLNWLLVCFVVCLLLCCLNLAVAFIVLYWLFCCVLAGLVGLGRLGLGIIATCFDSGV